MESEENQFGHMDELLIHYLRGLANDDERAEARKWINENSEHRKYFDTLKSLFSVTATREDSHRFNKTEGWKRVETGFYKEKYKHAISRKQRRQGLNVRIYASIAASLVIAFLSSLLVHNYMVSKYSLNEIVYNEISVPLGAKSVVTLSDGTKVWLNAGSKLRYPSQFREKNREVTLEGEGFFDVTHHENRQFLVKTSEITIKVFGTQFNVKAYPEENEIVTTLIKGSVSIKTNDGGNRETYLKPNETAVFYKSTPVVQAKKKTKFEKLPEKIMSQTGTVFVTNEKNPDLVTSWKDSRWIIDSEELGQLAVMLERKYNVKIVFINPELEKYKFTGILTNETFEQVMKIIQLSAPIEFDLNHNLVTIREDKLYKIKYDNMINKSN